MTIKTQTDEGRRAETLVEPVTEDMVLTDRKLVSKVRALIKAEHAGYVDGKCIEPSCSCGRGRGLDAPDPISGPFRDPPVRCTSFETTVLPLDPDLEAAYWAHVDRGTSLHVRRCTWPGCRKEVSALNAKFCEGHAVLSRRRTNREASRRRRDVSKVSSLALSA